MTALSKATRETIARKALKDRFTADYQALAVRRAALAQSVYEAAYTAEQRALIESLPEGWLQEQVYMTANFAGATDHVYFDGSTSNRRYRYRTGKQEPEGSELFNNVRVEPTGKSDRRALPYNEERVNIPAGPIVDEHRSIHADEQALNKLVNDTLRTTRATLAQFTTLKALIAAWPEIEPTARAVCPEVARVAKQLPAVVTAELNKTLGLPKEG